jgi:hypothetical protein
MTSHADAVRPTLRCLGDLRLDVPDLGTPLSDLQHPLIAKSQALPRLTAAGGGERIVSLTDRVWFKVKTERSRGAAAEIPPALIGLEQALPNHWWLGAAGRRTSDSPQSDFYEELSNECRRRGSRTQPSTEHLLPNEWDVKRVLAEATLLAAVVTERLVQQAAAESLMNSDIRTFSIGDRNVRVRIRVLADGEAYVAIGATGSLDHTFLVALLRAIPDVPPSAWLPEPHSDSPFAIELAPGEILWSAMLPPETQDLLLTLGDRG